jgi:DNA-binding NarL/FixJ family response regulator
MPGTGGLTAASKIAAAGGRNEVKVVIPATFEAGEYVYQALRAGASGFLEGRNPFTAVNACPLLQQQVSERSEPRDQAVDPERIQRLVVAEVLHQEANG